MKKFSFFLFLSLFLFLSHPDNLSAHGVVGQRFFPATIAVDDPFVADEMDLLGYSNLRNPEPADPTHTLSQAYWVGVSKRLTRDLGIELTATYLQDHFDGADNAEGFDNLAAAVKYMMFKSPAHEFIVASSLDFDLGGTGTKSVSDPFTTVTPNLFFGYGMGDLPDSIKYLRPLAVTGQIGLAVPITDGTSNDGTADYSSSLNYGFTVMYSTMYLQSFVKDIGLPKPFSRTIPLVEFTFNHPINGPNQFNTPASYAYPGFLWIGKYWELGVEAIVPMNSTTGSQPGVQALVHLFLDDISPQIFTRSLSGEILGPTLAQ